MSKKRHTYPELNYTWEPPTPESLYQSFQTTWDMIPALVIAALNKQEQKQKA